MRSVIAVCVLVLGIAASGFAQVFSPVKWTFDARHVAGDQYELQLKANIDAGWSIYSQYVEEGGPIPTSFSFDAGSHFQLEGNVEEPETGKTKHDPIFDMKLTKFAKSATFTQKVKVLDTSKPISGYLEFMTCDD